VPLCNHTVASVHRLLSLLSKGRQKELQQSVEKKFNFQKKRTFILLYFGQFWAYLDKFYISGKLSPSPTTWDSI